MELKRGERAQVRTEMVEFIALPFPFPSKLNIWSFHVVVVQWRQGNVQKSVMHVQSFFAFLPFLLPSPSWLLKFPIVVCSLNLLFLTFLLPSSSWFRKVPITKFSWVGYEALLAYTSHTWSSTIKTARTTSRLLRESFIRFYDGRVTIKEILEDEASLFLLPHQKCLILRV